MLKPGQNLIMKDLKNRGIRPRFWETERGMFTICMTLVAIGLLIEVFR